MQNKFRKRLRELREDYAELSWTDVVIVALFIVAVLGLLYGMDRLVERMR